MPAPEPPLKIVPSSRYQLRIAFIVSSTDEDEARARLLRHVLHADVEPHRRVEGRALVHEDVLELVAERVGLLVVDEVAVLGAPVGDRVGDPVDHLAQRLLALGRAEGAAEVLLGDDVGGVQRPRDRELDVGLEEGVAAVLEVRDARVAPLPLDGVVRMGAAGCVKCRRIPIPSCSGAMAMGLLLFSARGGGFVSGSSDVVAVRACSSSGSAAAPGVPPRSGARPQDVVVGATATRDGGELQHWSSTRCQRVIARRFALTCTNAERVVRE